MHPSTATAFAAIIVACGSPAEPPPPRSPVRAAPLATPRPPAESCAEVLSLLDRYQLCVSTDEQPGIVAWRERARIDLAASDSTLTTTAERTEIATACEHAVVSLRLRIGACDGQN